MVGGGSAKGLPGSISLRIRQTFFAEKTVGCRPQAKEMFDPKMIFFLEQSFLGLEQELVKKASILLRIIDTVRHLFYYLILG